MKFALESWNAEREQRLRRARRGHGKKTIPMATAARKRRRAAAGEAV